MDKMGTQVALKFSDFYEKWMSHLEGILQHHINTRGGAYASMVDKLTYHHKEFYKYKWELAHEDILSFFNAPIWLTPFENAHLWITGWKPSMAFRLVEKQKPGSGTGMSIASLSEEQAKKIEGLRAKIRVEENTVEMQMERVQVSTADHKTVNLLRMEGRVRREGAVEEVVVAVGEAVDEALKGLLGGLERVMKMGDCVRLKTLKGVLEILNPMQGVVFLASLAMVEFRVRKMGKSKEEEKLILG